MRVVTAKEIDAHLTFPALVDALALAFAGDIVTPVRHHHEIGEGTGHATLLLMPAWTGQAPGKDGFVGTKIVNVFPGNSNLGLPSVLGTYLLMSGETGAPLAALDGTRLTLWRTAAASALAARFLARKDASRLTLVGAGALSPFLARAHASQRPIRSITVWNHRLERAEALAKTLADEGFEARAEADLETAVRNGDIVSCATLSPVPLVKGDWLQPGTHLDLVGAFNMAMREADDAAVVKAAVYIDTPAALTEGGDVALALKAGSITPAHIQATLFELCRGTKPARTQTGAITLFKSVGTALEDLAAAMLVWQKVTA